ncbi:TPA: hypothetical protein ACGO62_000101 [Streptococcus suis]
MSVVVIQNNNIIPIDFGQFELQFQISDDNLVKREEHLNAVVEVSSKVKDLKDSESLPLVKETCQKAFDELFGPEAFEKVYELSGKSTLATASMLLQALNGVIAEYRKRVEESNVSFTKYLK